MADMSGPYRPLDDAADVTEQMLEDVADCLDGWFPDDEPLPAEDFIDKFTEDYLNPEWEINQYDSPAARKLLAEARKIRRER
jgi:hypothetical protein